MISSEEKNILSTGVGRRKSSSAFVKVFSGTGEVIINKKLGKDYFHSIHAALETCQTPLEIFQAEKAYKLVIDVSGGGLQGQKQAIRLAIAKAISTLDVEKRVKLRSLGLLSRDTRVKERKKYGLKKARKSPQYSKR